MNCDLCQNAIRIINLQQLISLSKDFRFLINMYMFFTFSLAPNGNYFSFLGFIGVNHFHTVFGDGRFGCKYGIVSFLII